MEIQIKIEVVELGERIKNLIKEKNLKIMNVAHDANLDSTNLRKYIRGTQDMRYTTLLRIASAIGVTPSQLLDGLQTKKEG
ncbi:helix-turn-helix domain-containing protein [Flavobacterium silvaticum]|uniref:Helix-turn-helix transcriptional regulator n=1 Tax=Flavobacterium silvaticum TaxID=1852020 RepID=A0A972JGC6_9FLAO|nr:helix-turn-helix transcriptional regulator [Flavobacterium silvaticum]NMH28061.1 helix-turn-helix transcriptional regulator [Flavobacterium silvaticum]